MTYFKTPPTLSLMQLFYVVCYTYFRLFLLLLLCDQFYVFLTDNSGISYGKGYGFQAISNVDICWHLDPSTENTKKNKDNLSLEAK